MKDQECTTARTPSRLPSAGAACGKANAGAKVSPPRVGGTIHVLLSAKVAHQDPQRIKSATEANLSRLSTRTLTTFGSGPGKAASEITGDLATDTGRPSDNNLCALGLADPAK